MPVEDYASRFDLDEDKRGGTASNFDAHVRWIVVQDGPTIDLPSPGVTLIVGGNNAGKSTLLRQLHGRITGSWASVLPNNPPLLMGQNIEIKGSLADAYAWLAANSDATKDEFRRNSVGVSPGVLNVVWSRSATNGRGQLDSFGRAITLAPDARTRFNAVLPVKKREDIAEPPSLAMHYLEDDPALMAELDGYTRDIFATALTLDRLSGQLVIRYGEVDVEAPPVDAVTPKYRNAVAQLTTLQHQGDGVGSTLGLLIPLVAGRNPIAFIDEPEAFLHPPQAYKLGATVARIARSHKSQIAVATHDRNFVAGALSETGVSLSVVRLDRTSDKTRAHVVEPERLREVWSSPILRHSNVLDGLFHRAVVVAENERDCVFYSAALEAYEDLPSGLLPTDILFVAAHGKSGIPEIASVLSAAHVPVVAVADLDVVRDKTELKKIISAVAGEWTESMQKSFTKATAEFRAPRKPLTKGQVLASVDAVLRPDPSSVYDANAKEAVSAALTIHNPWGDIKKYGMTAFRAARPAADDLVAALADQGVVTVHVGELEGFAPSTGVAKGSAWLRSALEEGAHTQPDATRFVETLIRALLAQEERLNA